MYIYTIDEDFKKMLIAEGCTLMFEATDIEKKPLWCLKKAPQLSFDINSSLYKDKCVVSNTMKMIF